MTRTPIKNLIRTQSGREYTVCGFIQTIRDQKRMQFIMLSDGTGVIQLVSDKRDAPDEVTKRISTWTPGSAVVITGTVEPNASVKVGGIELRIKQIVSETVADTPLPISEISASEKQLDWRYLALRRPANRLIFEVQTALEVAMREFWATEGFIEIHSPKLISTASESGGELFTLPYFDGTACLAQSPQFYKQMAMAAGFDRVFEIGPVFRANPSFTSRHDTEFTSVDMEISWINSHEDLMSLEERWLTFVLERIAGMFSGRIESEFGTKIVVPTIPFPRISLAAARALLESQGHRIAKGDLDPEGERRLSQHFLKVSGHEFVFVTDYPISERPFYHMRHPENPGLTRSFDLLWKGLEVTTGAQREHRLSILKAQVAEAGHDPVPLEDYLGFFRYGCPPHGGMGIGLTRLLMILLNRPSVRDVTYLYRGPNRLRP